MRLLLGSTLALAALLLPFASSRAVTVPTGIDRANATVSSSPSTEDTTYLRAGLSASARDLDRALGDEPLADWIQRVFGVGTPVQWNVNDCGEASGSAADSARDLPVCAEARVVLSGGREFGLSIAVGTNERGVLGPAEFAHASVVGPDTSIWFQSLSEIERFVEREFPVTGDRGVYLDERRNVHVVTSAGKDVRITKDGRYRDPKQSRDGRTIGMLVIRHVSRPGAQTYEPVEVADELWLYRGGRVFLKLDPSAFVRAWDFAGDGKTVATYSGALHFAGHYELYDLESGSRLDRVADPVTERSPAWARALSP